MLNSSGKISIGGSTEGESINLELFYANNFQSSLNNNMLRGLANATTLESQISLADFYSKEYIDIPGSIFTWGLNSTYGQLGDNTEINKYSPIQITGSNWKLVTSGNSHSIAIKTDNTLWAWGNNSSGQLGNNSYTSKSTPIQITGTTWKKVDCGSYYTIAIKTDNTLWAWGNNSAGQLGLNDSTNRANPTQLGGNNWGSIAGGNEHTSAIKTDGTLWTWGDNTYGQLGNNLIGQAIPIPTEVGGNTWLTASSSDYFSIAVKTDGTLWTWGENSSGQLGLNDTTNRTSPTQVGGTNWEYVDNNPYNKSAFAIKTDSTLWVWGDNNYGVLGTNDIVDRSSPVQLGGITWKLVASGTYETAAIKTDGTLWTWGRNFYGQLGINYSDLGVAVPSPSVSTETTWRIISSSYSSNYAIKTNSTLWVWGNNSSGVLGTNDTITRSSPTQLGGTTWKTVSSGYTKAAIKTDNTLWVWGSNFYGRLGTNDTINRSSPTQLGGTTWSTVSAGGVHTASVKTDNTIWLWGSNHLPAYPEWIYYGVIGMNDTVNRSSPTQLGGTTWRSVSCGDSHTIATKTNGTLWSWGTNTYGQLGFNDTINRSSPVQVAGTTWASTISGNNSHTIALKTDNTLWTWGINNHGQLGISNTINRSSPVQVAGTTWKTISYGLGANHVGCIKTDNTLWMWGINHDPSYPSYWTMGAHQLGLGGDIRNYSSPVQVGTTTDWASVTCHADYTIGIKTNNTLWSWGNITPSDYLASVPLSISSPVQTAVGGTTWKTVKNTIQGFTAIKTDGSLWYWGVYSDFNSLDSIYNGYYVAVIPTQAASLGTGWETTDASMLIKTDGTLWGFGYNNSGNLGVGDTIYRSSPTQVSGTTWKSLSATYYAFTASIKTDGTLWVWGDNTSGVLGDGTTISRSSPVQTAVGGNTWVSVDVGRSTFLAIKNDGTLWTWGTSSAQSKINFSSPAQTVAGGNNWKSVACGQTYTIATKTDGTLWGWGDNTYGQLGDSTINNKLSPSSIGGNDWKIIDCGNNHSVAIKTNSTLWSWGDNTYGQLGLNNTINRSSPTQINNNSWRSVNCGNLHVIATQSNDTLWTWGSNTSGQLGTNDIITRSSPTQVSGNNWKSLVFSGGAEHTTAVKFNF